MRRAALFWRLGSSSLPTSSSLPLLFSRSRVDARDFELLDTSPSNQSKHVLIEGLAKNAFYCIGGALKSPRQLVPGAILVYEDLCLSLATTAVPKHDAEPDVESPSKQPSISRRKTPRRQLPPHSIDRLTPSCLNILQLVRPSPDLILIGAGESSTTNIPTDCEAYLRSLGLNIEVQNTEHAVGAFNVLTQEERKVVGLFFPLRKIVVGNEDDDNEEEEEEEEESEFEEGKERRVAPIRK